MIAYVGNDHVVRLSGAQAISLTTGLATYLTDAATVRFRVQTAAHVDVAGETWPVTMTFITGSQGDFLGVLRDTVVLTVGQSYRLVATVNGGTDQYGTWDIPLSVHLRE